MVVPEQLTPGSEGFAKEGFGAVVVLLSLEHEREVVLRGGHVRMHVSEEAAA